MPSRLKAEVICSAHPGLPVATICAPVDLMFAAFRSPPSGTALAAKRALWSREQVWELTESLRSNTKEGEPVLSWWEGYPVLSGRPGFDGVGFWESNVARKLPVADARRFHVVPMVDLRRRIVDREPAAIVVPDGVWMGLRGVIDDGYAAGRRVGTVQIFLRRS